jgi:uncharacterized alpha-E superfamily protein
MFIFSCSEFILEEWKHQQGPSEKQIQKLLRNGASYSKQNFISWFRKKVTNLLLFHASNLPHSIVLYVSLIYQY